ncbi:MAG TPA: polysaccharide deacetylase family protein, partial [Candidatus Dormibacteraeota bacterium]|nr:polysaccharide deacetylase family protein [Candidatus Dormibacteraeota bacterium]
MRETFVASLLVTSLIGVGTASAAECPSDALGVSRTIVVDPGEHTRIGGLQYGETLPL